jgi:hypothetical protein
MFAPEFPRPIVILSNWAFGAIIFLALLQLVFDGATLIAMAVQGGRVTIPDGARYAIGAVAAILAALGVHQAVRVPPLMVALPDIKADLPDWPNDVVDQWLLKLANQSGMGWPPPDPMAGHRWELLLTHPISWWKDVTWTLETRDCSFDKLSMDARRTMNSMYDALVDGVENGFGGDNSFA